MHRSKIEKLMDYVIGEAVATLLDQNADISAAALAAHLQTMAATECDSDRIQALKLALAEINTGSSPVRPVVAPQVYNLNDALSASSKKH